MTYHKPKTADEKTAARDAAQAITAELMGRIDDWVQALAEQLQQGASAELQTFMRFLARFHHYSLNNQLLIEIQAPAARYVAGFHAWKKLGRGVKKGAKALRILSPLTAPDREAPPGPDGCPPLKVVGFSYTSIFAEYDTEGDALPSDAFMTVQGDENRAHALLSDLTHAAPCPVEWEDGQSEAHGWTDGGKIVLNTRRCAEQPAHAVRVFFHEWAHLTLHFQGQGVRPEALPSREVRELEADACAYVLSDFHGLDAAAQVSDYLTAWGGQPEALRSSLTRIQRAVSQIMAQLEAQAEQDQAAD